MLFRLGKAVSNNSATDADTARRRRASAANATLSVPSEIGSEVFDAFTTQDAGAERHFVATRPGHWRVDLFALARDRLAAAGVTQVSGGRDCTITDSTRFFSHRRDGRSGRMATLLWRDA